VWRLATRLVAFHEFTLNFMIADTYCRLTAWLNSDHGGVTDREDLAGLVAKYGPYACKKPSQIKVRRADTKEVAIFKSGPQVWISKSILWCQDVNFTNVLRAAFMLVGPKSALQHC